MGLALDISVVYIENFIWLKHLKVLHFKLEKKNWVFHWTQFITAIYELLKQYILNLLLFIQSVLSNPHGLVQIIKLFLSK